MSVSEVRPSGRWSPRRVAGYLAFAALLWAVGAGLVAPLLLRVLGAGSPLAPVLADWRAHLRDGLLILLAFSLTVPAIAALSPARIGRWLQPTTAEALAAIRIWIALILLASVWWEDLASTGALPRRMLLMHGQWLVEMLHGIPVFAAFLASEPALRVFELTTAALLVAAMAGLFTRFTVPAAALWYLLFGSILRSYAWGYHTGVIPLYALLLLSFTPCGDAWSVDRWLRARRGLPVEPAREPRLRYAIGRYLVWMAIALPYTLAALSKMRKGGFGWWYGEHMEHRLMAGVLEPMHFDFEVVFWMIRGPVWIFGVLGFVALMGELTFVLVLVSRWARLILPVVMAGMHVGILLLQNILFPDLIAIQAVFYDWTPVRDRIAAWAGRLRPPAMASSGPMLDAGRSVVTQARLAQVFLAVAILCWATRTERFPFTAMQMFSGSQRREPVEYVRPMVVYADGTREQARFENSIGAVADSRYRWLLRAWDKDTTRVPKLREFLDVAAERANRNAPPGRRIREFQMEVRRWDYAHHPADPQRGRLLYVLRHVPRDRRTAAR
ncbi:MAG TPA: hypothetical protein VF665_03310 [Longimicrobium sp.]|uniref:hypothetical protein n=1 Tax=Longimicrobium sp. TaxID=2029185 RepID=UPI002ED9FEB6